MSSDIIVNNGVNGAGALREGPSPAGALWVTSPGPIVIKRLLEQMV